MIRCINCGKKLTKEEKKTYTNICFDCVYSVGYDDGFEDW
jgi:DNA-directed RNA polymerase subunit RPC12/RpoP